MPDNIEVTYAWKCADVRTRPTKTTPTLLLQKLQHTDNCCTATTVYHCNQHPIPFLFNIQLQNKQQQYSPTKLESSTSSSSSDEHIIIVLTITSTFAVLYITTSPALSLSLKEHLTSPRLLLFTSFAFMRSKKTNGFKVSPTSPTTTATTEPPTGRKYKRANCTKSDTKTSLATALTAKVNLSSTLTTTTTTTAVSAQVTTSVFLVTVAVLSPSVATVTTTATTAMSPTSQIPPSSRTSLFDSCHRKIRLIGGGPVAFLGGLVAKARRKEREGDHNSTDTKLYLEESVLERKLPEADLKALVDLPAGLDYNEWLASHTLALFEHVNLVYGTISEFCTPSGCADMTGPGNRTYLWFDEKGKKTRVAAPQYIDYVMTFTQKTVSDESIFPTKYANEFPSSFESIARKILRLQFHVIAHLYAAHFREIALLGLHTHLNLTFAHLTALHRRFTLIDEKETDVLRDLEVALRLTDDSNSQTAQSENNQASVAVATSTATTSNESGESSNSKQIMEEVNSRVQHNNISVLSSLIFESKESVPPICTQPEPTTKSQQHFNTIGLMSGILGDLSTGELSYCASPVPASSFSATSNSSPSCTSSYTVDGMTTSAAGVNNDAEPGTLHFNFNHNSNNNNNNSQYHNHHLLHHVHAHQNLYTPNSGLIQCNATNAPSAVNTTSSTTA